MRLMHLQLLRAIAQTGSLRAAAEAMHLSQPALTKALRQLEMEFGAALVVRSSRGARLAPAGELLAARADVQRAVRERTRENLGALDGALAALGDAAVVRRVPADAGWYAILEVPRIHEGDAWIALLLERARAIVHPGYFFDFPADGSLVVSLLPPPDVFRAAIARVLAVITDECA